MSDPSKDLLGRIATARQHARNAAGQSTSNPYLPEMIGYLDLMDEILRSGPAHPRYSREERGKIVGGFGRLALDNYAFAESPLGTELFDVVNSFADDAA
jgi:hypothetical protein